jgi:hypothetical protein
MIESNSMSLSDLVCDMNPVADRLTAPTPRLLLVDPVERCPAVRLRDYYGRRGILQHGEKMLRCASGVRDLLLCSQSDPRR